MSRRMLVGLVVVIGCVGVAVAGDVIFTDGLESGGPCSWSSEYANCGGGTEMVISLAPGDAVTMTLVYVPPGTFHMGSPTAERGRSSYEDLHEVTLTQGYFVGKYEVTQGQWQAVTGTPMPTECGSYGVGADYPVYCASWNDIAGAGGFVAALNAYLASTGQATGFRLPTEAEWERAARGGNQDRFSHGDVLECDDSCGACATHSLAMWWCGDQPTYTSQPVGEKLANGYGLYDLHGNEYEWVQDWWQLYLGTSPVTDPTGPGTGSYRVFRGGSWYDTAQLCRSAYRFFYVPTYRNFYVGFRLARTAG